MSEDALRRRLERERRRVEVLETMIEDKTREIFFKNQALRRINASLVELQRLMPGALVVTDVDGTVETVNAATLELLGMAEHELVGRPAREVWPLDVDELLATPPALLPTRAEHTWRAYGDETLPVLVSSTVQRDAEGGEPERLVFVGVDLREHKRMEVELRHAHKLESVGQLAAGIAHEINTPMQFVGDNVAFLRDAFVDVLKVVDAYEALASSEGRAGRDALDEALDEADLDYLRERVPRALERTTMGIDRVSKIVRGMKTFAHPDDDVGFVDVNRAVETTLTVARNEYRYVADVELALGEVPNIVAHGGDINQVLLNLVVNAAHAIEGSRAQGQRGTISIETRRDGEAVEIAIRDTGGGIPDAIRHRIFDPFFTTKEVGKGTGQGLAIAHSVVVDRHGGALEVDSKPGEGTTFTIRLPISARARVARAS